LTAITLLEKAYGSFSIKSFEAILSSLCKDLKAEVKIKGKTTRDWVQIEVMGEDESVALRLLDREIGLTPVSIEKIGKFSVLRGKVVDSGRWEDELHVDIGVFAPRVYDAFIPLWRLRAQLADGRNLSLQRLIEMFCLSDFAPLKIKLVSELNVEEGSWEAELSEEQLSKFSDGLTANLDRLMVLGANRKEVEVAVEKARHFRDVVRIETLGPLEHAIICKLGTDAVGLTPKLGPYMRAAYLAPFSPRKIKQVIGIPSL